ncbi:MAG: DNA polymerase III subunit delta [Rickettsiales bacterium]|nr:MAG: DNA polymerase III subunit delta [Rickettsiales bacterium]
MKFYSSGLADLIRKIEKGDVKSLLIHGVNHGFATTAIEQITKKLGLSVTNLTYKEVSAGKLSLIANNQNFFGQKELIKISDTTTAINKEMKTLITDSQFYHFICFVSNDSLPASGIRKFFEDKPNLASLGCYYDNEQTIAKMIVQQCKKRDKSIDEEALFYLKSHLKGDQQIIKSELQKLFYYTHDKPNITKDDILKTLSPDLLASGDEMCIFFAQKEPMRFLNEIEKLKSQGKNEVLMIRALIRYYLNIYNVAARIEDGSNIDIATRSLTPPIFFKYVDSFKRAARKTSSSDAIKILAALQDAEVSFKTNPSSFDLFETYIRVHGR